MSVPLEKLTTKELQRLLKTSNQSTAGRKATLVDRLRRHLASKSEDHQSAGSDDDGGSSDDLADDVHATHSSRRDRDTRVQELHLQMQCLEDVQNQRRAQRQAKELELAKQDQEDLHSAYQRARLQAEIDVLEDEAYVDKHTLTAAQSSLPYTSAKTKPSVKFKHQPTSPPERSGFLRTRRDSFSPIQHGTTSRDKGIVKSTYQSNARFSPSTSSSAVSNANRLPRQPSSSPSSSLRYHGSQDSASILLQQQMLEVLTLPKPQLLTFDGDPLRFHIFLNMFDSAVDDTNINDAAKLNRLFDLCKGKAFKVIESCALYHPSVGYPKAREMLIKRFGNDYDIAESYVNKIIIGPQIGNNSVAALQDFCDDVRGCAETLRAMGRLDEVDTRGRLVKLVQRLPYHMQTRWRKIAVHQKSSEGIYPGIDDFLRFLEDITVEISDPVFGVKESKSRYDKNQAKPKTTNFTVKAEVKAETKGPNVSKVIETNVSEFQKPIVKCVLCGIAHPIYMCSEFKAMPPDARLKLVKENNMCLNCLKISKHTPIECRVERICGSDGCKAKHSYLLHHAIVTGGAKRESALKVRPTLLGVVAPAHNQVTTVETIPGLVLQTARLVLTVAKYHFLLFQ